MTPEEEIQKIEEELGRTKYNKATQKHIGLLKAKLAQLRAKQRSGGGKKGAGYSIRKCGDATVLLVGFPSVGKSTLLNMITNAESKIGEYDFTTLDVIPGVMEYRGARIQVLDIPGMVEGASSGKGRGKEILSVIRSADLILIMVDVDGTEKAGLIEKELYEAGFRLNQNPPDIRIYKNNAGGINISGVRLRNLGRETIISVLNEFGVYNADVVIRGEITLDQLIDSLMKNRVYVPSIVLVNKADLKKETPETGRDRILISALEGRGVEELRELIWEKLGFIRIYMKRPGKEPDMREPLILRKGFRISTVCREIHKKLEKDFRFARLWGPSAKFPGQKVGFEHELRDGDILELHTD